MIAGKAKLGWEKKKREREREREKKLTRSALS